MEERIYRNIWKEIGISDAQVEERLSQPVSYTHLTLPTT